MKQHSPNRLPRRSVRLACGAAIAALVAAAMPAPATAQSDFPSRRITVIVPYPAGGIVDNVTRIMTEKLAELWKQTIVVEAKPGANSNLGTEQAARAEPDGYTWVFMGPSMLANPRIYSNLRWSEKSFTGVAVAAWAPAAMVVPPDSKANTVKEFVALAKAAPRDLMYGNAGIGSSVHLNTAIFANGTGSELTSVPYKGQPPAIIDLLAGRIHVKFASIGLVAQHVEDKKLKALAVIGNSRSPMLPNVPTMTEAGYPAVNVVPWYGFAVPRGVPAPIVDKIVAGFGEALRDPATRKRLEQQALQPVEPMSAKEIADLVARDTEKYAQVIRDANIKLND
ncbi:MAG: tripartite tricarboxylate transporter substrate binding protein [Hyphomicrobiaceae bacterium]|nr:tripartite tricarboxylate transporter substrate binding protein [Hyphomicrobiaceae bacterium]